MRADQNETAPREAGPQQGPDTWVSELEINDEAMRLVVFGLARECHEFALARGIPSHSVEDQLPLVLGVLDGRAGNLLDCSPVAASGASDIAGIRIGFSPVAYRRLAEAAKDRVAGAIDRDGRLVV